MSDQVIVGRDFFHPAGYVKLAIYRKELGDGPAKTYLAELMFKEADRTSAIPDSCTSLLDAKAAQSLMDQLWECGVRPAAGAGSAGQMAATEKHLEDTRKLLDRVLPLALREKQSGKEAQ